MRQRAEARQLRALTSSSSSDGSGAISSCRRRATCAISAPQPPREAGATGGERRIRRARASASMTASQSVAPSAPANCAKSQVPCTHRASANLPAGTSSCKEGGGERRLSRRPLAPAPCPPPPSGWRWRRPRQAPGEQRREFPQCQAGAEASHLGARESATTLQRRLLALRRSLCAAGEPSQAVGGRAGAAS